MITIKELEHLNSYDLEIVDYHFYKDGDDHITMFLVKRFDDSIEPFVSYIVLETERFIYFKYDADIYSSEGKHILSIITDFLEKRFSSHPTYRLPLLTGSVKIIKF